MPDAYVKMPVALAQAILDHLVAQPYATVYELVAGLQSLERHEDASPDVLPPAPH